MIMFSEDIRILIVDDMMTMRKIVSKSCKELGFNDIIVAKDGAEALEQLKKSEKQELGSN